MGLSDNPDEARQTLSDAEIKQNRWLQDPDRLIEIRDRIEALGLDQREPAMTLN